MEIAMDPVVDEVLAEHAEEDVDGPRAEGWEGKAITHPQVLGEGEGDLLFYQIHPITTLVFL